jgi:uncharacterized protein (DUF2237 family)
MTFYNGNGKKRPARNVLGGELKTCSMKPLTGFYRNGKCDTGPQDGGVHAVCTKVTREFLDFSVAQGNDLVTPMPAFNFPGSSLEIAGVFVLLAGKRRMTQVRRRW